MNQLRIPLIAIAAALVAVPAAAQTPGTVAGEMKVGGKAVPLKFVHVQEMDDVEGLRLQGTPKKYLAIRLTDMQLPPEAPQSVFRCGELADAGKLHGVEIRIDSANGKMYAGTIYFQRREGIPASLSISTDNSQTYQVKDLKLTGGTASGTVATSEPQEWPTLKDGEKPDLFEYHATFSAPITQQPKVTAILTPAQAAAHPAVKALLAYEAAGRNGNLATARKLATPAATEKWDTYIKQIGEAEFIKLVKQGAVPTATRLKQIVRVVVRGDRATVILKEEGATSWMPMVKKATTWLVDAS